MATEWRVRLATAPTTEPIDIDEAKEHLRVDHNADDALIDGLIGSARVGCEQIARRAFLPQTWDLILDAWPTGNVIELPYPPLQSVSAITYVDSDEQSHTLSTADYGVDADSEPGRVYLKYGKSWPGGTLRPLAAIKVRFVAGYADADAVPWNYKVAIKLTLSAYYENRGDGDFAVPEPAVNLLTVDRGSW
jgi:uncharacterized phiE125 gp8 family phage protein